MGGFCLEFCKVVLSKGRESRKLALAVLVSILHLLSAIFLIREFPSRTIQRNVSVGEYLPGEMMLFQLGIKTSFI